MRNNYSPEFKAKVVREVLREAGLVRVRVDAQKRWYGLDPAPLAEVDRWLAPYRRYWADRLDQLERAPQRLTDPPAAALRVAPELVRPRVEGREL